MARSRLWLVVLLAVFLSLGNVSPMGALGRAVVESIALLEIDGQPVKLDKPLLVVDGHILLPMRGFFQACGASVDWNVQTRVATCRKGERTVIMVLDLPEITVNGVSMSTDLPIISIGGCGSFMLALAQGYATRMNDMGVACRFLVVDADTEFSPRTPEFYEKNGFRRSQQMNSNPNRKAVSMRYDIFTGSES